MDRETAHATCHRSRWNLSRRDPADRLSLYQTITAHPDIQLAYVTGRSLESVLPLLADPTLPQPDYIIADVGASLYHGETLQPIQPLQQDIDARWPGETQVASALADIPELVRQDIPQARRCSYFCTPERAADPALKEIAEALDCDLLYSADLYLDFLPRGVNKGSSLLRLVELIGIDPEQVLVAGDTLNDLAMLGCGLKASAWTVGAGLLEQTQHCARVLHADSPGCGGIIQAFSHFGFLGEHGRRRHAE